MLPPTNPKFWDTFVNDKWQKMVYKMDKSWQLWWVAEPTQQTVMTARDLPLTTWWPLNDNYILLENENWTKTWHLNTDANRKKWAEQQAKRNEQAILDYENKQKSNNNISTETPSSTSKPKTSNWWWKKRTNQVWNSNAVKQPEPTYVDSDWVTHTWMTQEEFDNSMRMYEIDNQWWYNKQRSKTIWESWMTADQMFKNAIDKFNANPDAFNDEQKKVLLNAWIQLWYYNRDWSPRKDVEISEEAVQPSTATESTRTAANPSIATTRTSNQWGTHVWYGGSWWEWYATDNDRRMQWWANSMFWSL